MPVYTWENDKEQIIDRLRLMATLKIGVKLLEQPSLIEGWIEHHAKIVGMENLIIADNGSRDRLSLDIYEKFSDTATIFRFAGPHNEIHWHSRFDDLFKIIRETCQSFAFFDADERLVFIDGATWTADSSIISKILRNKPGRIIPATWLINILNEFHRFSLLDTEHNPRLWNNLRWGKPIIPAGLVGVRNAIHNVQFDDFSYSEEFGVQFFLLHYTQFPEQRIEVNRKKLISRGIIDETVNSYDIPSMNFDHHEDRNFMRFVVEIEDMIRIIASGRLDGKGRTDDYLTLESNGAISFSNENVRKVFLDYLSQGREIINSTFECEPEDESLVDADSLLAYALALRQKGSSNRVNRLLRRGMALYPGVLDQYGGPVFRKELMRTLLAGKNWQKARELCPSPGDAGGVHWHKVLFARACSAAGDTEAAANWWDTVLVQDPDNGEARRFLADRASQGGGTHNGSAS